jgi:cell division protease FtsH
MSGFDSHKNMRVIVIAATNLEKNIDDAIKRSGRFSKIINIDLPDEKAREKILTYYLGKLNSEVIDSSINEASFITELAQKTDGLSPADLDFLINEAALLTIRRGNQTIDKNIIYEALTLVTNKAKKHRKDSLSEEESKELLQRFNQLPAQQRTPLLKLIMRIISGDTENEPADRIL